VQLGSLHQSLEPIAEPRFYPTNQEQLLEDGYDLWLDPGIKDVGLVSELLKPYNARMMRCYPVSTRINHVVNDDEECSAAMEVVQTQNELFS
jgi:hypothetical protein